MNYRQVHLDFHTSEKIEGIGSKFSKEQFQRALKLGHVDSIIVFSKCHHGWAYHPSKANEIHPHLDFDLLKSQIDAAHEIGVKAPIYLSGGFDEKMARRQPNWLIRNKDETTTWINDFTKPAYHKFCFNSSYLDYFLKQIEEVVTNYECDGIFIDVVGVAPCYCQNCITTLLNEGKDPYDEKNIKELAERVHANYAKRVRETIDKVNPNIPVFHNGGHIRRGRRDLANMNTHLELESLPTGGAGYDHFPLSVAYARTLGMEYLGMTGKFHYTWGEFGGFKHPNALKYEVGLAVANGAKCSIGDQLHPTGEMDLATYDLIGKAFEKLEERELWLKNAENVADVAILSNQAIDCYYNVGDYSVQPDDLTGASDTGCARILLEGKYLFNVIDCEEDFNKYKLLILPDNIRLDKTLIDKIRKFIKNGGKILASGKSGLSNAKDEFALDFGVSHTGINEYKPTFIRPNFELKNFINAAFVVYSDCQKIELNGGKEMAISERPYFNRSLFEFCSHMHAPSNGEKCQSSMVESEIGIYISYDIFNEYATWGEVAIKEILLYALDKLLGENATIKTNLPAQGITTVTKLKNNNIVHLLYASPIKRGKMFEVIEDALPIYGTNIILKTEGKVKSVTMVPEMIKLDFVQKDGKIDFVVPKFEVHQMIEIKH